MVDTQEALVVNLGTRQVAESFLSAVNAARVELFADHVGRGLDTSIFADLSGLANVLEAAIVDNG